MGGATEDNRIPAVCADCGAVYVAVRRQDGEVRPVGSKPRCRECDGTEFESISERELSSDETDPDD